MTVLKRLVIHLVRLLQRNEISCRTKLSKRTGKDVSNQVTDSFRHIADTQKAGWNLLFIHCTKGSIDIV